MPRTLCVYIGNTMDENFRHGLEHGIWGLREGRLRDVLAEGDYVVFGRAFSGGSPRVKLPAWLQHSLADVVVGRVTQGIRKESTLEWPDEKRERQVKYPDRFRFERISALANVRLNDDTQLPIEIAEGLQLAATGGPNIVGAVPDLSNSPIAEPRVTESTRDLTKVADAPIDDGIVPSFLRDATADLVGIHISQTTALRLVASLCAKRFLILAGLAGSGKTQIALAFARWISESPDQYQLVPVGADWIGNENIVGYPDGLDKGAYVMKPALSVLKRAAENPGLPHFLILDEMNLSHVERYFSDVLSAIESDAEIPLYEADTDSRGQPVLRDGVPNRIRVAPNLFIIGTVNVDETTYMFSPKVLDRANVIEFRIESAELDRFLKDPAATNLSVLDGSGMTHASEFVRLCAANPRSVPEPVGDAYASEMKLLFDLLRQHHSEFGYRVAHEIARFLHFYHVLGGFGVATGWFRDAMDAAIIQKLLPKLHGSRSKLEGLLWSLSWACGLQRESRYELDFAGQIRAAGAAEDESRFGPEAVLGLLKASGQEAYYPLSFEKVYRMWRSLVRDQFVTFAEA